MEKAISQTSFASIRYYYNLSKPGILMGNLLTAIGGATLAFTGFEQLPLVLWALTGMLLVMASACALNNCIDRDYDAKMIRTRKREIPSGLLTVKQAMVFSTLIGLMGFLILLRWVNFYSFFAALFGFIIYVFCYSFAKHTTHHATLIGSFSGATPPVIGYCAIHQGFDLTALMLFITLLMWQMPHFYAISIFRKQDYEKASLPVLPLAKGLKRTQKEMLYYSIGFLCSILLMGQLNVTKIPFTLFMSLVSLYWVWLCFRGFKTIKPEFWARRVFLFSLIVISSFSLLIRL